jgi:hypothetical protein
MLGSSFLVYGYFEETLVYKGRLQAHSIAWEKTKMRYLLAVKDVVSFAPFWGSPTTNH